MTALLGLLAVAGYQNRDKLAELLRGATSPASPTGDPQQTNAGQPGAGPGLGGLLGGIGSGGLGGLLGGGLSDLVKQFDGSGQGELAESWVGTGPNKDIAPHQVEKAVGHDVLDTLAQQTGLSKDEILARLSRELPKAVDGYTPHGRLPTADELSTS